jgi:hypothetical protein
VTLPISALEISLAWPSAWFAVAPGGDLDRSAAAGGLDGARRELRLHLFHLLLHSRSLFHEFANAGHFRKL